MIRLFAGFVAVVSALGVFAQNASSTSSQPPSHLAPKAQTLSGRSGATIASAVVDFSELAAQEAVAPASKKVQMRAHHHPKASPFTDRTASTGSAQANR